MGRIHQCGLDQLEARAIKNADNLSMLELFITQRNRMPIFHEVNSFQTIKIQTKENNKNLSGQREIKIFHTEQSLEPKCGVKSGNISTWVFNKQISGPTWKNNQSSISKNRHLLT